MAFNAILLRYIILDLLSGKHTLEVSLVIFDHFPADINRYALDFSGKFEREEYV